jgi:hypothetical protein
MLNLSKDLLQCDRIKKLNRIARLFGGRIAIYGSVFVVNIILVRLLSHDMFGRYSTVMSLSELLNCTGTLGSGIVVFRETIKRKKIPYDLIFYISAIGLSLNVLIVGGVRYVFDWGAGLITYSIFVAAVVSISLMIQQAMRAQGNVELYVYDAAIKQGTYAFMYLALLVLWAKPVHYGTVVVAMILSTFAVAACYYGYALRRYPMSVSGPKPRATELVSQTIAYLGNFFSARSDVILFSIFYPFDIVGLLKISLVLGETPLQFVYTLYYNYSLIYISPDARSEDRAKITRRLYVILLLVSGAVLPVTYAFERLLWRSDDVMLPTVAFLVYNMIKLPLVTIEQFLSMNHKSWLLTASYFSTAVIKTAGIVAILSVGSRYVYAFYPLIGICEILTVEVIYRRTLNLSLIHWFWGGTDTVRRSVY